MRCHFSLILLAMILACGVVHADTFGSGDNVFEIPFVTIGEAGNAPDTTGDPNPAGSVAYEYRIGKYEIPEEAIRKANAASALDGNPLGLTLDERGPQKPATRISWFEAAQFVNWLNEEKGQTPAYKFDGAGVFQLWAPTDAGYNAANPFRNTQAHYFIPNIDEWYKAAFYDPATGGYFDFPTGSNDAPIPVAFGTDPGTAVWNQTTGSADVQLAGGASPFGTVAQGGNVLEWLESPLDGRTDRIPEPDVRAFRGEDWGLVFTPLGMSSSAIGGNSLAIFGSSPLGFRIASIPEPTSIAIVGLFFSICAACVRPQRHI